MSWRRSALLKSLGSLRLTLALLAIGLVLVFIGTIEQMPLGTYGAQKVYFKSWFVFADLGGFPFPILPGGQLIASLLVVNLLAAHLTRFKLARGKIGIHLLHAGVLLLLIGQIIADNSQVESFVEFEEGQTIGYSVDFHAMEFALTDRSDPEYDVIYQVPTGRLLAAARTRDRLLSDPVLPLSFIVHEFFPNARLTTTDRPDHRITHGLGLRVQASPIPKTYNERLRNLETAIVEPIYQGKSLGIWMVSNAFVRQPAQTFQAGTREFAMEIRPKRYYLPGQLTLRKFTHERYPGTRIPKNFSSLVQISGDPEVSDREVLIKMNHPMRYRGQAFYQAGFDENNPRFSRLQVVSNPSWAMPYIGLALITAGMVMQFSMHLIRYVRREEARRQTT